MAKQTGPRTAVGKLNSSRNALKKGIYTNAVLPGEDPQALEELAENLSEAFAICDAAGEITIRRYLQHTLQANRLQMAQTDLIQAKMHSHSTRLNFCREVNLNPLTAEEIPCWYFDDDPGPKENAKFIYQVFQEAAALKKRYTADLMLAAKTEFPNLWKGIMGTPGSATQKVYATLGERLASSYKHQSPQANIQCYLDSLMEEKKFQLYWGENESRYTAVIAGLRAKAVMDVISDPNLSRAEAALHRRSQELLTSMVALKRENSSTAYVQPLPAIVQQPIDAADTLKAKVKHSQNSDKE